jgi:hypothetical protein
MSDVQTNVQTNLSTALVSSNLSPAAGQHAATMLRTCLVVSGSAPRAALFSEAARLEHWSTIVCRNADDAARNAVRHRIQLALVDLESAAASEQITFCRLVEQLAGRNGPLLVVCGRPNDEVGEVWSRQLGVWMYLPGINDRSNIGLLYDQARRVVEKLENAVPRPVHGINTVNGNAVNGNAAGQRARSRR